MSDTVYCYHCRCQHARAETMLVETGGVRRWRCRRSIALARRSVDQRDAFGRAVSAANRSAQASATRPLPHPVSESLACLPVSEAWR